MIQNIQYASKDEIKKLQTELFKTTAIYLSKYSEYYKKIFEECMFIPQQIETLDDLQRLPITTKKNLLEHNEKFFCSNLLMAADLVSTSGSTGLRPIVHLLTKCDLRRLACNEQMSFNIANMKPSEHVMINTALDGSFVAGMAYYLGVKRIGASVIRAGSKNWGLQLEVLKEQRITTIVGVPSNLIKLYHYGEEHSFDVRKCGVEKLILIGESIRNKDYTLNQLGKRLSECYPNAKLYSTYANTETCTSFCECEFGCGGHLLPDLAYAEIVDHNGLPLAEGESGRLIITTFCGQGMPLLRYDTGDITFMRNEQCICGRTTMRIGPILSRDSNIIKIGGITFSQAQMENVILSVPQIDDYCVVIDKNKEGIYTIQILYSLYRCLDDFDESILKREVWNYVRVNPVLKRCSISDIEKIQTANRSRKPQRFINKTM